MLSRIARAAFVTTKPSILYSGLLSAHRRSLTTEGNESSSKTTNPVGGWIKSDLENIHTDIRGLFATDKPELLEIARYYFDGSGKSIRPLLICAMARLVNRQLDEANGRLDARQRQIALIAEMIHVSSLIHDDIIDHSELRRGRASVNARWGAPKAVLAGDYILAVASRALAQLGDAQVVETLSRVLEDLVKGELMQFGTKEDENERFEHYTTKTYRKTASLIANSCKAVAILAQTQLPSESTTTTKRKENEALCELSYECGRHIGIAFQLIDDVLDFTSHSNKLGKPGHGADLRLGLATAPVLFAAARHPQLNSMIMRRFGEEGDVARAFELVLDSNGIAETRFLAAKYCENAERLLDTKLRPSHEIDYLKFIIRSVINRDK